jgi:DUF4097 and DUF4098 domain-containing protein YvlB
LGERGASVKDVNGGIELRLANGLNADLTAREMNGNVRSDIPNVTVDKEEPGSRYSAHIGNGGTPITLSGINGNVRLTRSANSNESSAAKASPNKQTEVGESRLSKSVQ